MQTGAGRYGEKCQEMKSEVMRNVRENGQRCAHSEIDQHPGGLKPCYDAVSECAAEELTARPSGTLVQTK